MKWKTWGKKQLYYKQDKRNARNKALLNMYVSKRVLTIIIIKHNSKRKSVSQGKTDYQTHTSPENVLFYQSAASRLHPYTL
jgi:hypothetical protein